MIDGPLCAYSGGGVRDPLVSIGPPVSTLFAYVTRGRCGGRLSSGDRKRGSLREREGNLALL